VAGAAGGREEDRKAMGNAAGRRPAIFAFPAQPCGGPQRRAPPEWEKYLKNPGLQRAMSGRCKGPPLTTSQMYIAGYFIDKRFFRPA